MWRPGKRSTLSRATATVLTASKLAPRLFPLNRTGASGCIFHRLYAARRVSAEAVLRGAVAPNAFANQVAIIGSTALGVTDVAATPIATRMVGAEIQAQLVENILAGTRLKRPPIISWLELLTFLSMAIALIVLLPRMGPGYGVAIFLAGALIVGIVSIICFFQTKLLYDPSFRHGRKFTASDGATHSRIFRGEPAPAGTRRSTSGGKNRALPYGRRTPGGA